MSRRAKEPARSAADFLPESRDLKTLAEAAQGCRGCDLYQRATQAVFGEGGRQSRVVLVGEQPGGQEDLAGRPFVGPAGKLLDQLLVEAGIDRDEVYVTNAVKHFKWEARGTRRLHAKPTAREVAACRPWLEAEIAAMESSPLVVCLGATAAQSLLGSGFRITKQRGEVLSTPWAKWLMTTWHPSALLRAPTPEARATMRRETLGDFQKVARQLHEA